jgi:hypothetical protein
MELAQVHTMMPLTTPGVLGTLRSVIPERALHPRARLGLSIAGPWRPADLFPGAIERLAWTASFEVPGGQLFTDEGAASLGRHGILRRHGPVHPAELFARAFGDAAVVLFSDATRLAYVAVYRERHLRWSLQLEDRVRIVRCDGHGVTVEEPPVNVPEGDRTGVLLAGLYQWLREPIEVDAVDRYLLVEMLGAITGAPEWVAGDGHWDGAEPEKIAVAR